MTGTRLVGGIATVLGLAEETDHDSRDRSRTGRLPSSGQPGPLQRLAVMAVVLAMAMTALSGTVGFVGTASAGNVSGCTTIDSAGTYTLTSDVENSSASTCISITSSNVVFDGQGHTVDGVDNSGTIGIDVNGTSSATTLTNVTIRNVTVTDWGDSTFGDGSIEYTEVDGGTIVNVNVSSNEIGIQVSSTAPNTTIRDVVATRNGFALSIRGNRSVVTNVIATNNSVGMSFDPETGQGKGIRTTVRNANVSANGVGIEADSDGALFDSTFTNITAVNNINQGFEMRGADSGVAGATLTNITSVNNGDDGVFISVANITLRNSRVAGNDPIDIDGNRGFDTTLHNVTLNTTSTEDISIYYKNEDEFVLDGTTPSPDPANPPGRVLIGHYMRFLPEQNDTDVNLLHTYECESSCWLPTLWRYNSSAGVWEQLPLAELGYPEGAANQDISLKDWNTAGEGQVWYNVSNINGNIPEDTAETHGLFQGPPQQDPPDLFITIQSSLNVTFNATVNDSDTNVTGYVWDFGDGTRGNGSEVTHTYDSEGTYNVTLFLLTENGTALYEKTITATNDTDTTAPTITDVSLGASNGEIDSTFNSSEQLGTSPGDITAEVYAPGDSPESDSPAYTFDRTQFAEQQGGSTYQYTLTATQAYDAGSGTYTLQIADAKDSAGNNGGLNNESVQNPSALSDTYEYAPDSDDDGGDGGDGGGGGGGGGGAIENPGEFTFDATVPTQTLEEGETLTVRVTVRNNGALTGEREIALLLDGDQQASRTVEVDPGEQTRVTLEYTVPEAGDYSLRVAGNELGTVSVSEAMEQQTPTEQGTDTPDSEETPDSGATPQPEETSQPDATPDSTPEATDKATPEATTTPGGAGPGFGVIAGVLALVVCAAALLARR